MEMVDAGKLLADLGFGDYETRAYLALLRRSPVNGYELAKTSDVPRGNIYSVLQRLEERGAVLRMETPEGTRYAPVPAGELLLRLKDRFDQTLEAAGQALAQVARPADTEHVWNLEGYDTLLGQARSVIESAGQELLLAVWPEEARVLEASIEAATERGTSIRTLCLAGCPQECGACRGRIHRHRIQPPQDARWLVLVPDRAEVLAGEVRPGVSGETAQAVRTRQRLLVDLTASYIRHSVALAALLADVAASASVQMSSETRDVLGMLSETDGLEGWLGHLQHALSRVN